MISRMTAAAAMTVALALSCPAYAAGALVAAKCGGYGYSTNISGVEEARRIALRKCEDDNNEDCRVVLDFHNFCVAFAYDDNGQCGAEGWGSAAEHGAAEDAAMRQCINQGGGNCTIRRWVCDSTGD